MGMNNMLKTFGKHLLIPYAIILGINVLLAILGLSVTHYCVYASLCINIIFSFLIGYILYGSYGRSFALIQNNKKSFAFSSLLFLVLNSLLLSIFTFLIVLITLKTNITFLSLIIIFSLFIGGAYFGSLYGLLLKNKKVIKLFFMIIVLSLCFIFIFILVNEAVELLYFLFDPNANSELFTKYLICIIIPSIICCATCNTLYLKLNIAKVYSHE